MYMLISSRPDGLTEMQSIQSSYMWIQSVVATNWFKSNCYCSTTIEFGGMLTKKQQQQTFESFNSRNYQDLCVSQVKSEVIMVVVVGTQKRKLHTYIALTEDDEWMNACICSIKLYFKSVILFIETFGLFFFFSNLLIA